MVAETFSKAEIVQAEEEGKKLARVLQEHFLKVTERYLDAQKALREQKGDRVALVASMFALEIHFAAAVKALAHENAETVAANIVGRVKSFR